MLRSTVKEKTAILSSLGRREGGIKHSLKPSSGAFPTSILLYPVIETSLHEINNQNAEQGRVRRSRSLSATWGSLASAHQGLKGWSPTYVNLWSLFLNVTIYCKSEGHCLLNIYAPRDAGVGESLLFSGQVYARHAISKQVHADKNARLLPRERRREAAGGAQASTCSSLKDLLKITAFYLKKIKTRLAVIWDHKQCFCCQAGEAGKKKEEEAGFSTLINDTSHPCLSPPCNS